MRGWWRHVVLWAETVEGRTVVMDLILIVVIVTLTIRLGGVW